MLNSIGDIQTIITCTGLDDFVNNRFEINKVFRVANGTVDDRKIKLEDVYEQNEIWCKIKFRY